MTHPVFILEKRKAFKLTTEDIIQLFYRAVEKADKRLLSRHNWKRICYLYGSNRDYYFLSTITVYIQDVSWDYISTIKGDVVDVLIYLGDGDNLGAL